MRVPVIITPSSAQSMCFLNVMDAVRRHGGEMLEGWVIWVWKGAFIEAEHHAVWRTTQGELFDVTVKPDGEGEILFLPDPKAKFEKYALGNIMWAYPGNPLAKQFVDIANQRVALIQPYRQLYGYNLPPRIQSKVAVLEHRMNKTRSKLIQFMERSTRE